MFDQSKLFDRLLLRKRRNHAAQRWHLHNFLKQEAAQRLSDRLQDLATTFPLVLDLGAHKGELAQLLRARGQAQRVITMDLARAMQPDIVSDEEFLPFAANSFDCVVSALSLHHVNDLPGALIQIYHALKSGGLFLASTAGANTLKELRESITAVSSLYHFALSPRLSPLIEVRDGGALLQRAGFAEPVADSDTLIVEYDDLLSCMQDLRGMGENNILHTRQRNFTTRKHLAAMDDYYRKHFSSGENTLLATFEFVTLTAWKK